MINKTKNDVKRSIFYWEKISTFDYLLWYSLIEINKLYNSHSAYLVKHANKKLNNKKEDLVKVFSK